MPLLNIFIKVLFVSLILPGVFDLLTVRTRIGTALRRPTICIFFFPTHKYYALLQQTIFVLYFQHLLLVFRSLLKLLIVLFILLTGQDHSPHSCLSLSLIQQKTYINMDRIVWYICHPIFLNSNFKLMVCFRNYNSNCACTIYAW